MTAIGELAPQGARVDVQLGGDLLHVRELVRAARAAARVRAR
jgi:hypothetical protein